jgi:hypothetical protein
LMESRKETTKPATLSSFYSSVLVTGIITG